MACTYVHALGIMSCRLFRARWGLPVSCIFIHDVGFYGFNRFRMDSLSPEGELLTERLALLRIGIYLRWRAATFRSSHPRSGSMKVW